MKPLRVIISGSELSCTKAMRVLLTGLLPNDYKLIIEEAQFGEEVIELAKKHTPDLFVFYPFNNTQFRSSSVEFENARYHSPSRASRIEKTLELVSHVKETFAAPVFVISGWAGDSLLLENVKGISDWYSNIPFEKIDFEVAVQKQILQKWDEQFGDDRSDVTTSRDQPNYASDGLLTDPLWPDEVRILNENQEKYYGGSKVRNWAMEQVQKQMADDVLSERGLFILAMHSISSVFSPEDQKNDECDNLLGSARFSGDPVLFELGCYLYFRILTWMHFNNVPNRDQIAYSFFLELNTVFGTTFGMRSLTSHIHNRCDRYKSLSSDRDVCLEQLRNQISCSARRERPATDVTLLKSTGDFFGTFTIDTSISLWDEELVPKVIEYVNQLSCYIESEREGSECKRTSVAEERRGNFTFDDFDDTTKPIVPTSDVPRKYGDIIYRQAMPSGNPFSEKEAGNRRSKKASPSWTKWLSLILFGVFGWFVFPDSNLIQFLLLVLGYNIPLFIDYLRMDPKRLLKFHRGDYRIKRELPPGELQYFAERMVKGKLILDDKDNDDPSRIAINSDIWDTLSKEETDIFRYLITQYAESIGMKFKGLEFKNTSRRRAPKQSGASTPKPSVSTTPKPSATTTPNHRTSKAYPMPRTKMKYFNQYHTRSSNKMMLPCKTCGKSNTNPNVEMCDALALLQYQLRDNPAATLTVGCNSCGCESQYGYSTLLSVMPENIRPIALPKKTEWALVLHELNTSSEMKERAFFGEHVLIKDIQKDPGGWMGTLVSESKLAPKLELNSVIIGRILNNHCVCISVRKDGRLRPIPVESPKPGLDIGTFFLPKSGDQEFLQSASLRCANPSCAHFFGISYTQFRESMSNQIVPTEQELGAGTSGHLILKCELCQTSRVIDSRSFDGLYKI